VAPPPLPASGHDGDRTQASHSLSRAVRTTPRPRRAPGRGRGLGRQLYNRSPYGPGPRTFFF
ncbi:unnamed protein product, partial [Musa textilis]